MELLATRVSSPAFIGRVEPLGRIEAAVARAATGEASAVVVGGEAGVGKTRLLREVATRAAAESVWRRGPAVRSRRSPRNALDSRARTTWTRGVPRPLYGTRSVSRIRKRGRVCDWPRC